MRVLLDTNILLRLSEKTHSHHAAAVESLRRLAAAGDTFCIGSQTVAEFLAVATRPIPENGLGMDQSTADAEPAKLTSALDVLYDSAAVLVELRRLVVAHAITGKTVHDAKLVAAMRASAVRHILTFNRQDFTRFDQIEVLDPATVAAMSSPQAGE